MASLSRIFAPLVLVAMTGCTNMNAEKRYPGFPNQGQEFSAESLPAFQMNRIRTPATSSNKQRYAVSVCAEAPEENQQEDGLFRTEFDIDITPKKGVDPADEKILDQAHFDIAYWIADAFRDMVRETQIQNHRNYNKNLDELRGALILRYRLTKPSKDAFSYRDLKQDFDLMIRALNFNIRNNLKALSDVSPYTFRAKSRFDFNTGPCNHEAWTKRHPTLEPYNKQFEVQQPG